MIKWLLSPTIGVQQLGRDLGWTDFVFDWITQPDRAIYTLVFAGIWHQSGLIMAIMLAGLRGVDREIWRAARIEGIPTWRTYVSIILPMLRPLIVTCVTGGFCVPYTAMPAGPDRPVASVVTAPAAIGTFMTVFPIWSVK